MQRPRREGIHKSCRDESRCSSSAFLISGQVSSSYSDSSASHSSKRRMALSAGWEVSFSATFELSIATTPCACYTRKIEGLAWKGNQAHVPLKRIELFQERLYIGSKPFHSID